MKTFNTAMRGREDHWTFVGSEHPWKQREDGVILSPFWAICGEADAPGYFDHPLTDGDDLAREDYAFLHGATVGDLDLLIDFQIRRAGVVNMGVGFRAQDSVRMYCVQVNDMLHKAHGFDVTLWLQDGEGFRRLLGSGIVSHPEIPEHIRQGGPKSYDEWVQSSPGWSTLRVRAMGPKIQVAIDDQEACVCTDETYASGTVALLARWTIPFQNLELTGTQAELSEPWRVVPEVSPRYHQPLDQPAFQVPQTGLQSSGTAPKYSLPFDGRLGPYEVFPTVAQDAEANIYLMANIGESPWKYGTGIVRSTDAGKTWVQPQRFADLGRFASSSGDWAGLSPGLYAHQDGSLSCFFRHKTSMEEREIVGVAESADGGHSWSQVRELIVSGKPLSKLVQDATIILYAPPQRLRDGALLMSVYHVDDTSGHTYAETRTRSAVFRSTDDGRTWGGPHYIDTDKFDSNECSIAELPDGRLQAFMRTCRAPSMWTSWSTDGGLTWSPLELSGVMAQCPCVLGHSSGAILLGSRGMGVFLNVSRDGGRTWEMFRISPASGMMGMTELPDGRVLIVYHSSYRVPARIRAQFLRVTPTAIEAAE